MGRAIRVVVIALCALAFLALMLYVSSWSVRGWVAVARWDGQSTLECYGSSVMRVRGRTVDMTGAASPVIDAAGNCELELVDCHLAGRLVLGGDARVTLRNSTLDGGLDVAGDVQLDLYGSEIKVAPSAHVEVSGNARVAFHDSGLVGNLQRSGNATVTGIPELLDRQQALEDLSRRFGGHACDGVVDCYQKSGAFGNISGRLVVDVDASGRASGARLESDAPPAVRDCLVALGRARTLDGYDGKPGRMTCVYAGSVVPGAMRMSLSPSFAHVGEPSGGDAPR